MIKLLFTLIIFISCLALPAQRLRVKNTENGNVYYLGLLKHLKFKRFDSNKQLSAYIRKVKDDTLYFIGRPKMALSDIYSVKFTPKNFFSRAVKPFVYGIGIGFSALFASNVNAATTDYTFTTADKWRMFGESVLVIGTVTEATGLAIWLITPKKSLTSGQNLELSASR